VAIFCCNKWFFHRAVLPEMGVKKDSYPMPQKYIEIRGACENNLKNISLRIPKRKITIFTGVSGSGKSSIVFDTVATEAQRQLNENFSLFVRNFLPRYAQPEADAIENLSMAVVVDQKRLGGGSHSTLGTITDIYSVLRLLYSRIGQPHVGTANLFSFNDPQGMCPECNGIGRKIGVDMDKFLDTSRCRSTKARFCSRIMLSVNGIGTF
jgi:excinuclease UvrABC ATPase subunit